MATIRITQRGKALIEEADKQRGIYPNNVYTLTEIKDGKWYNTAELQNRLKLADWNECYDWLRKNRMVEEWNL